MGESMDGGVSMGSGTVVVIGVVETLEVQFVG